MTRGSSRILNRGPDASFSSSSSSWSSAACADHRAELEHAELLLADPDPPVDVQHRPARLELDRRCDEEPERDPDDEEREGDDQVERALRRPLDPRQHRRPQLEQRHALARDVLALVDEQLGRGGGELDLHPVPVGELDDLEDGLLVEVRLGQHELVGPPVLEQHRQLLERRAERRRPGRGGEGADDLDTDPPARRTELPLEIGERVPLPDEQQTATHPRAAHQLERDRVVGRPQEPDRERARRDGGRDQPGGREVVVRPEAEREDDQGDEDERAEDPPRARAALARGVEPRLEEDEHGDRREERQPLGGPGVPEERPVHRVAVHDGAQHEGEVHAEREPGDVGRDEHRDAHRPAEQAGQGAARQQIHARAADVGRPVGEPAAREGPGALFGPSRARRGCLARHPRILRPEGGRLPARDVLPGEARAVIAYRRAEHVEVTRRPPASEQLEAGDHERAPPPADEIGVVEVGVDARREAEPQDRPHEVARAVRRRHRGQRPPVDVDACRCCELRPGLTLREVRRPPRARRAVDVAELRAGERDGAVRVPPAAAEERRPEAVRLEPRTLAPHTLARGAARGPRVGRAREVRVMAERPPVGCLPGPGQPELLVVLPCLRVRRPDQRRDREPSGPALLERREGRPDAGRRAVVRRDTRPLRTVPESWAASRNGYQVRSSPPRETGSRRRTGGRCGCAPAARRPRDRAGRDPRGVRREERHVRPDSRLQRHVRLPSRCPVRVHAAALRVVPRGALLAARALVGRRRAGPGRRRRRDGAARPRDRESPRDDQDRRDRRARRHAAPVSRVARRPREPRDPRRAPRCRDGAARAPRVRAPIAPARARHGRGRGARDPLQRPPAPAAPGARALRRVARATRTPRGRGGAPRRRRRRGGDRPVGRPQPGRHRVRDGHDGHARALEGEQPRDVRRPRRRRLDRRRARPAGGAALAREGGRDLGRRREGGRRVRPGVVLPRPGSRLLARPAGREGAARRPGRRDALVTVPERGRRRPRAAGPVRPAAAHGRAGVRPRPLRARPLGRVPRTAPFRGAGGPRAGLQHPAAMVFAGTVRYRAPWDFVLALLAAFALERAWALLRSRRAPAASSAAR